MYSLKTKFQLLFVFTSLFIGLSVLAFMDTATADETGTRSAAITHTPSDTALDISIAASQADNEYISPEFTAQFQFNGIGLVWTGPETSAVEFALQVDDGAWQAVEMMGDEAKDTIEAFTAVPLFITGQTVRYKITGDTAAVQNVRLVYFDSTIPPYRSMWSRFISSTATNVVSREQWGADESYRFWEPEYQAPEKIVIHHTAGGDGGADPMATIRGIYYWHAVVLGWGDIGYNYLIDPAGTVYEGRYGGDGVIGAHAYNSETDTNYNYGSLGVALLGCYETSDGACNTLHSVTEPMQTALVNLIAEKTSLFGFNPAGSSRWFDQDLPNVLTHRDIDQTYCPGDSVHDLLDTIRTAAANGYTNKRRYQAMYAGSDLSTIPTATIQYTNVGRKPWRQSDVAMQMSIAETNERQRVVLTTTIAASDTAALSASLPLPKIPGDYTLTTRLYRHGQPIRGSKHTETVTVENPYQLRLIETSLPLAMQQSWTPTLQLVARNVGKITLPAGTTIALNGETIYTIAKDWPVREKRTLDIPLATAASWDTGVHRLVMTMTADGIRVPGARHVFNIRID